MAGSGHTPVSNIPDEMPDRRIDHEVFESPSAGPGDGEPATGQVEAVGERRAASAPTRTFTAPSTSALRDVAEASYGPAPDVQETVHGPDGAVVLPTDLGNRTGWLGFGVYPDEVLTASAGNISGYPGDKPTGTRWYDFHRIAAVDARKVYYDIDTFGGQSGSAVYRIVDGGRYGIAIHAYGGSASNSGTRIVRPVFDNLVAWKT